MKQIEAFSLIGISLPDKTSNENGQSNTDCGNLWQRFEQEKIFDKIPRKTAPILYAVYHNYDGGHMDPFSYFIGAPVVHGTPAPEGLSSLNIPGGDFQKFTAAGLMPACIGEAWQKIWQADIIRAFNFDFEIYDERSHDWNSAEIDIFISVK